MESDTCVLFLTHVWNEQISEAFSSLREAIAGKYDLHILVDVTNRKIEIPQNNKVRIHDFTISTFSSMGYPRKQAHIKGLIPGNCEMPILWWFRNNTSYDRYWIMEFDVRFTGNWKIFFGAFENNDADLLGSTLFRYSFEPNWVWWKSLKAPAPLSEHELLRGFFPMYRLSNRALVQMDTSYREGWGGHHEVIMPTILLKNGFRIEDMGGDNEFSGTVKFYYNSPKTVGLKPGTWTPLPNKIDDSYPPNLLWHSIKSA